MKKLLKILKNKSGVTLIELVIGMVISVIITTYVSAILAPMLNVFYRSNDLAEVNTLFDNISEVMINDFSRATAIEIIEDAENGRSVTISTSVGDVVYTNFTGDVAGATVLERVVNGTNTPVFAANYYKRKTLSISINDETETAITGDINAPFTLKLSVADRNGGVLATRDYAVNPIFLQYEDLNNN